MTRKIICVLGLILLMICGPVTCLPPEEDTTDDEIIYDPNYIPGGPGEPEIGFLNVPLYGNKDNLTGYVEHVSIGYNNIAVYIKGNWGWYTKPYWASSLTRINFDGTWEADITTGSNDEYATQIIAYLVPAGYQPPLLAGQAELPEELGQNALAVAEATRSP